MSRLSSRNNVIIIALSLFAVYTVYSNIIAPLMQKDEISADRPDMYGFEDEQEEVANSESHALKSVNTSVLFWDDTPTRDPFVYQALQGKTLQSAKYLRKVQRNKPVNDEPVMRGFVAGVESKLAVLDNKIVRIGQKVGRYTVLDIDPQGVHLIERDSKTRLKLKLER